MSKEKKGSIWMVLLLIFGLLLVGVAAAFVLGRKSAPPASKGPKVSLSYSHKALPVSKGWKAFVREQDPKQLKGQALTFFRKALRVDGKKGPRWYPELGKAQEALAKLAPHKARFLALMKTNTCPPQYPFEQPKDKARRISSIALLRGVKLVSYDSAALAQAGKPDAAAAQMLVVYKGLKRLSLRCHPSMISTMIYLASFKVAHRGLGYALVHPKLSVAMKAKALEMLRGLASLPNEIMADAFRAEHKFQQWAIDNLNKSGTSGRAFKMKMWPWWDPDLTREWMTRAMVAEVHRAKQPFGPGLWKVYPIQQFVKEVRALPQWRYLFQYNAIGMILFGIATPVYRKFLLKFHQTRCLSAALHAASVAHWREHKQPLPTDSALLQVKNPLTGKAFAKAPTGKVCAVSKPGAKKPTLGAVTLQLPPAPPAGADAPAGADGPTAPAGARTPAPRRTKAPPPPRR